MTPTPDDINRIVNGGEPGFFDDDGPTVEQLEQFARFELMVYSAERQEIHNQKARAVKDIFKYLIFAGVIIVTIDAMKQIFL